MGKTKDAEVEAGAKSATSPETAVEASETSATPADGMDTRVAAFNVELQPLLNKHRLKLAAEPFIENGQILARPVVVNGTPKTDIITP